MESLVVAESVSSVGAESSAAACAEDDTVCVLTAAEHHHAVVALVSGYSCRAAGSTRAVRVARLFVTQYLRLYNAVRSLPTVECDENTVSTRR